MTCRTLRISPARSVHELLQKNENCDCRTWAKSKGNTDPFKTVRVDRQINTIKMVPQATIPVAKTLWCACSILKCLHSRFFKFADHSDLQLKPTPHELKTTAFQWQRWPPGPAWNGSRTRTTYRALDGKPAKYLPWPCDARNLLKARHETWRHQWLTGTDQSLQKKIEPPMAQSSPILKVWCCKSHGGIMDPLQPTVVQWL